MSIKHGWNAWANYLKSHENYLKRYEYRMVNPPNEYKVSYPTSQHYELKIDKMALKTDKETAVYVKIEKDIEIDDTWNQVRARCYSYSYHAWTAGGRNLIRYCSPHDHRSYHHKHTYGLQNQVKIDKIGADDWPHVSEFLDEVLQNF